MKWWESVAVQALLLIMWIGVVIPGLIILAWLLVEFLIEAT